MAVGWFVVEPPGHGGIDMTLKKAVAAAFGVMGPAGAFSMSLAKFSAALAGTHPYTGTFAPVLKPVAMNLSGGQQIPGTMAVTLPKIKISLGHLSGAVAVTLPKRKVAVAGIHAKTGGTVGVKLKRIAFTGTVLPVQFQAVSLAGTGVNGFSTNIGASAGLTTVADGGLVVIVSVIAYNSIGPAGNATRVVTFDGAACTEIPGAFIVSGNWYTGLWIKTNPAIGAKTVAADVSGAGNAGRQIWIAGASYVRAYALTGGAAQATSAGVGQTIASSGGKDMIVNAMGAGAAFGAYSQTSRAGPFNVPGNFTCGVMGEAAGGVSRTFSCDQGGFSASVRLTP